MLQRPGSIVLAWAAGWAAAAVLLVVWFAVAGPPALPAVHLPAWIAAGAFAFGAPAYVDARRAGAPSPGAEAVAWTATCALAAVTIRAFLIDWYVPVPGEVNAVTIVPGARRTYSTGPPSDLTLGVLALTAGGFLAGLAVGLLRRAGALGVARLAVTSVVALWASGVSTVLIAPIMMHFIIGGFETLGMDAVAFLVAAPGVGALGGAAGGAVMEWLHDR